MDGFTTPRRKLINGKWYTRSATGQWIEDLPAPTPQTNSVSIAATPQPSVPDVLPTPKLSAEQSLPRQSAVDDVAQSMTETKKAEPLQPRWSLKKKLITVAMALAGLCVIAVIAAFAWYQAAIAPVSSNDDTKTRITIVEGSSPAQIAQLLHKEGLIRSTLAFDVYTRVNQARGTLQQGTYALSPSQPLAEIVDHLTSGVVDAFQVTFFPGGTLTDYSDKPMNKRTDVQSVLLRAGYDQSEIDGALSATYSSPLFADKPASSSLEGYVYGETYSIDSSMTAKQVLQMTFDEYYKQVQTNDLIAGFAAQGLNLHQGIIMASIVQSEMGSQATDMAQVAQVFLKRYREGAPLGSDVTAYYGADLLGRPRAVSVDSDYNTRIRVGLPKGPISSPGLAALRAVAQPAAGDYVYFLSGDDGVTYFSITNEQHEKNIIDHCKVGCSIP